MISSFLSKIFWIAFVLVLLGGISDIICQITLKPLQFKPNKNSLITFGQPGLVFNSRISNRQDEKYAPDTTVRYSYATKLNSSSNNNVPITTSNSIPINASEIHDYRKDLDSIIKYVKNNNGEIKLDTEITFIGEIGVGEISDYSSSISGVDSVNPNKFIFRKTYENEKGNVIKEETDTFSNKAIATKFLYLNEYKTPYKIVEELEAKQSLRILPKNKLQQFFFLVFKLIIFISSALLLLTLSNLFKKFSRHYYFTHNNIKLLKKIGWLILIPQMMIIIFYWTILFHIRPAKVFVSYSAIDKVKLITQYELNSGIDWQLIFIGLSIIVLSIIFKNGLKMKEEQELTV